MVRKGKCTMLKQLVVLRNILQSKAAKDVNELCIVWYFPSFQTLLLLECYQNYNEHLFVTFPQCFCLSYITSCSGIVSKHFEEVAEFL